MGNEIRHYFININCFGQSFLKMNKLKIHHHGENVHSLKHNEELKSESDEWEEDPVKFLSKDRADEF